MSGLDEALDRLAKVADEAREEVEKRVELPENVVTSLEELRAKRQQQSAQPQS